MQNLRIQPTVPFYPVPFYDTPTRFSVKHQSNSNFLILYCDHLVTKPLNQHLYRQYRQITSVVHVFHRSPQELMHILHLIKPHVGWLRMASRTKQDLDTIRKDFQYIGTWNIGESSVIFRIDRKVLSLQTAKPSVKEEKQILFNKKRKYKNILNFYKIKPLNKSIRKALKICHLVQTQKTI